VDEVDKTLEELQVLRCPKASTEHHAVEGVRSELLCSYTFSSFAQIDQATVDVVSQPAQAVELGIDERSDEIRCELRRLLQINDNWVKA
jgi:hypothetical protein